MDCRKALTHNFHITDYVFSLLNIIIYSSFTYALTLNVTFHFNYYLFRETTFMILHHIFECKVIVVIIPACFTLL